jgi:hypothetical protein
MGLPRPSPLADGLDTPLTPFVYGTELSTEDLFGPVQIISVDPLVSSICGWLARPSWGCPLGEVKISGVPIPEGASNFEDKIALLSIDVPEKTLQPGGQLPLTLTWQSLTAMDENYTIFLQVLDEQDRIVGQVDAWPLQGTYPTSLWSPGEIIEDPYVIQLAAELPPGTYRLQMGFYLLSTLRRLSMLDENGRPVDDKITVGGFLAP